MDAHSNRTQEYTKDQVESHDHNDVFNITEYLENHPGGADILIEVAGSDATAAYEDAGHSNDAAEIMQSYMIGTLKGPSDVSYPAAVHLVSGYSNKNTSLSRPSIIRAIIFTFGISAAFCLYRKRPNFHSNQLFSSHPAQKPFLLNYGFISGIVTASLVYILLSSLVTYYVARSLRRVESGFAQYPAYIQVGHEVFTEK
ncbi:cytochrome b5 reductase [Penicillium verhagenii]|nr:cytochrome b5 reductase [Penicillium verhagenii]